MRSEQSFQREGTEGAKYLDKPPAFLQNKRLLPRVQQLAHSSAGGGGGGISLDSKEHFNPLKKEKLYV